MLTLGRCLNAWLTACAVLCVAAGCSSSVGTTPTPASPPAGPTPTPTASPAPVAGVTAANGTLYGATSSGGAADVGTVFSVSTSGSGFAVLHDFGGTGDGSHPFGTVIAIHGVLYGTTSRGGANGDGTAYRIAADGTSFTESHTISGRRPPTVSFPSVV